MADPARGRICFQTVPGYQPPEWPGGRGAQQMHLDVLVADLEEATRSVLGWRAPLLTDVLDPGAKQWRIFADPAGHPFCLVTVPE
ncbi:MAG TPA: VOC family protein [Nocardioidaceae bacterium]|nr:VOC family protein [Nocardioidaceae bacterium]